jgi:hypothetical protein
VSVVGKLGQPFKLFNEHNTTPDYWWWTNQSATWIKMLQAWPEIDASGNVTRNYSGNPPNIQCG